MRCEDARVADWLLIECTLAGCKQIDCGPIDGKAMRSELGGESTDCELIGWRLVEVMLVECAWTDCMLIDCVSALSVCS